MNFYTQQHKFYCGIDLHAKSMYLCIINQEGEIVLQRNIRTDPKVFLNTIERYREDIVVAVECIFIWYWIADLCAQENIPFILGHALYMKAIHGGKAKNDKIDAHKIAVLLRGGMIPMAYVYPQGMRSTRDLLRRRMHLTRKRAELLAHIQNTNYQYNLPDIGKKIAYKANREGVAERFPDESVRKSIELDLKLLDHYDQLLPHLEHEISLIAKIHDPDSYFRIRSIPGIGRILGLVILYEIHEINRFPRVQDFVSYCRLVKSAKESAGKRLGSLVEWGQIFIFEFGFSLLHHETKRSSPTRTFVKNKDLTPPQHIVFIAATGRSKSGSPIAPRYAKIILAVILIPHITMKVNGAGFFAHPVHRLVGCLLSAVS